MKKILIKLSLGILLISGCSNKEVETFNVSKKDTINIFNSILTSLEVKMLLKNYNTDIIFVLKNENINQPLSLNFPTNKKIIFVEKPKGYPKYGHFDYKKLQISFELLKINRDTANCMLLIKTVGLLGDFKLVKRKNTWLVTSYSKNLI
jgi:hypothetical protein